MTDRQAKDMFLDRIEQRLAELCKEGQRRQRKWERWGLPIRMFFCRCSNWTNRCYPVSRFFCSLYSWMTHWQGRYTNKPWLQAHAIVPWDD